MSATRTHENEVSDMKASALPKSVYLAFHLSPPGGSQSIEDQHKEIESALKKAFRSGTYKLVDNGASNDLEIVYRFSLPRLKTEDTMTNFCSKMVTVLDSPELLDKFKPHSTNYEVPVREGADRS